MILSQLNDEKICKKINSNPEHVIMKNKKKKALITRYKPSLTDSEYKNFSNNYFEASNLYDRPKTHKSGILHKTIKEQNKELITISQSKDLKLTPIVGGSQCQIG